MPQEFPGEFGNCFEGAIGRVARSPFDLRLDSADPNPTPGGAIDKLSEGQRLTPLTSLTSLSQYHYSHCPFDATSLLPARFL